MTFHIIRKHLYIIMVSLLFLSTGVFLFLWHASHTFARSSNNDLIEFDYWNNDRDGSTGMIINALYGDGIGQADKTFYTQYWDTHLCDPNAFDVQYIAAGTDTLPAILAANTIYVLDTGDHNMSYSMQFAGDCTAVVGKSESDMIIARVKYLPSANSGVFIIQNNNRNIVINNIQIQEQVPANANINNPIAGVYVENSNANTIWPGQGSNSSYGVYVGSSTDITVGGGVSDNPYGHYIVDSNDINIGTPWPITLPWENGTGVYVANSTNVIIDADPRDNTNMGMHIYNSTGVWVRSRYIALNESPGTLIENVYNSRINGAHGGNLGYGVKIINSHNITGGMSWPQLNNPTYYGQNNSNNIGVDAHGLIIDGSTDIYLTGLYLSFNDGYGMYITDSQDIGLEYVTTIGNDSGGIYMSGVNNLSINRISVTGNQNDGIYMENTDNIRLQSGYIAQNVGDGIHASGLTMYHTYTDNDIYNNDGDGIQRNASTTDMSAYNTIDGNDIGGNDVGLRMQGQGSQLTDNTISNNDIHDNDTHGIYMHRGYFNMFDNNFVYDNGAKGIYFDQTVGNTVTGQNVYGNGTEGLTIEGLLNNHIYSSYFYDNGNHGIHIYGSDDNDLSGAIAYQNAVHGIFLQNANNTTIDKSMTFGNNARGLSVYQSFANTITNLQTFSNLVEGLYIDASTGNVVHNVMTYNNGGAGIGLYDNANYNTINNVTSFSQQYGIALQGGPNDIIGNVFNTINAINNVEGIHINAGVSSIDNVFHNISTVHNTTALFITGGTNNNLFYGTWFLANNNTDFDGTGAGGILDAAINIEPDVAWSPGYLTVANGSQTQMTCNYAVQATFNGSNLLDYPYCDTIGTNPLWTGGLGVEYTFFPYILKQSDPVAYNFNNDLYVRLGLQYSQTMFAGDYSYIGDDMIGGYVELDETGVVAYQSGGFTYNNYPHMLVHMVAIAGAPDYVNTGVGDPLYNGLATTLGGTFQTPLTDVIGLPLIDQEGLKIVRTYYTDGINMSHYYGLIRGLAYDDISITKTASTGEVQGGAQISFTITVENSGALAGTSQVFDMLPRVISETGLQMDPVGTYSGDLHGIIWDMSEVAEDTTYTFIITGFVKAGYAGQEFVNTGYFISDYTHLGADLILYSEAAFMVVGGCGDYILGEEEQCDDGNTNDNDGCSAQCTFEIPQTCGLSGNLVPNPGFESYIQCPTNFSHFTGYAASWYSPSPNADYMRLGCPFGMGIASAAEQYPHGGSSGMVHILTYASNIPGAGREYIGAELLAPMEIGKSYDVGFCYATTAISNYISDKIGMLFSTGTYPTNAFWSAITDTPQFEHTGYIVGTGWTCVSGTVYADQAYERFLIGSFHTNTGQSIIPNPMWNPEVAVPGYDIASYVIDDVFVSESCAVCGNNSIEGEEQCDFGDTEDNDGCNNQCEWETPSCTLGVDVTGGLAPLSINLSYNMNTYANLDYIDYGDMQTGTDTNYIYTSVGTYVPTAYIYNTLNPAIISSCSSEGVTVSEAICGDGIMEGSEQCDDGANNGIACDPSYGNSCDYCAAETCSVETIQGGSCGDAIVQSEEGEQCDNGETNGISGCAIDCTFRAPTCTMSAAPLTGYAPLNVIFTGNYPSFVSFDYIDYGDGVTGTLFQHIYTSTTGVSTYQPRMYVYNTTYPSESRYCVIKNDIIVTGSVCGNSIIDIGEQCDSGSNNGLVCNPSYGASCNYCTNSCETSSITGGYCGDGITENSEQCDDGNTNDNDLCSNTCIATCGDGNIDGSEQCDLGEDNGLGACTSACLFAPPQCTLAAPNYSEGIVPVYVPFNITCLDYTELAYIDYGDGTTGTNFSGHTYTKSGNYTPIIYFQNILGGALQDDQDDVEVSTTTQRCGDGIKNGGEQCDGGSDCTITCKYRKKKGSDPVVEKDVCPDGDFSASYYDKTCGVKSQHAAAETLDKYSIIHGDYNKGPEDPARYSLDRILKRNELRKIMVRTITDQKYDAPFAGETWADKYKMIMEGSLGIVYGSTRAHEDQVTYLEAINSILEGLYHLKKLESPVTLRTMVGGSRPITRGQMMALVVRFILPEALQSVEANMTSSRK